MKYRVLGPGDYKNMPWKNGGGVTCELLREPQGDSEPFDWRISVADIRKNGPFSLFPGCTRVISALKGAGMRLTVDGRKTGDLGPYIPFTFSGESAVESELINGPISDFNLIFRRDKCQARLEWLEIKGPKIFATGAGRLIIYALNPLSIKFGSVSADLAPCQTIHMDNREKTQAVLTLNPQSRAARLCLIELF